MGKQEYQKSPKKEKKSKRKKTSEPIAKKVSRIGGDASTDYHTSQEYNTNTSRRSYGSQQTQYADDERIDREIKKMVEEITQSDAFMDLVERQSRSLYPETYKRALRKRKSQKEERKPRKGYGTTIKEEPYHFFEYVKFAGEDPIKGKRDESLSDWDIRKAYKTRKKPYVIVRKNVSDIGQSKFERVIPAASTLGKFISDDLQKGLVLTEVNPQTNEILGTLVFRKTKKTPKFGNKVVESFWQTFWNHRQTENSVYQTMERVNYKYSKGDRIKILRDICDYYHIKVREIPAAEIPKKSKDKIDLESVDPTPQNRTLVEKVD